MVRTQNYGRHYLKSTLMRPSFELFKNCIQVFNFEDQSCWKGSKYRNVAALLRFLRFMWIICSFDGRKQFASDQVFTGQDKEE